MLVNKIEVIKMAEFCLECWNKINETNDPESDYIIYSSEEIEEYLLNNFKEEQVNE